MERYQQLNPDKRTLCRVELHAHLDGNIRFETMWEMMKKKNVPLPGNGSLESLKKKVTVQTPQSLASYLDGFSVYLPAFAGDVDAMERVAYEFVEDKYNDRVLYVEARFAPHLLLAQDKPEIGTKEIIKAVNKGFRRAEADFKGIKARIILCDIRAVPEWAPEIVDLAYEFRHDGVVGIDLSGDEQLWLDDKGKPKLNPGVVEAFKRAKQLGIHRTVHAGEAGPATMVRESVEKLYAERIGHGYHVIDDPEVYSMCKAKAIHFEACPSSSLATKSVPLNVRHHPILKFCEDRVSFSINSDDFSISGKRLDDDYQLLSSWGMREVDFSYCNFQAAEHVFLPEDEKKELKEQLKKVYGML